MYLQVLSSLLDPGHTSQIVSCRTCLSCWPSIGDGLLRKFIPLYSLILSRYIPYDAGRLGEKMRSQTWRERLKKWSFSKNPPVTQQFAMENGPFIDVYTSVKRKCDLFTFANCWTTRGYLLIMGIFTKSHHCPFHQNIPWESILWSILSFPQGLGTRSSFCNLVLPGTGSTWNAGEMLGKLQETRWGSPYFPIFSHHFPADPKGRPVKYVRKAPAE